MRLSVIIPVHDQPEALSELLESIASQPEPDFEVIIVEDGSKKHSQAVFLKWQSKMHLRYLTQERLGPGPAGNLGAKIALGSHYLFLSPDCQAPAGYLKAVMKVIDGSPEVIAGGPDVSVEAGDLMAQAFHWVRNHVLTTGGARAGKSTYVDYFPREHQLLVTARVFNMLGGFRAIHPGVGIDFGVRAKEQGMDPRFIPELAIQYAPKENFHSFLLQSWNAGRTRGVLGQIHPETLKPFHFLSVAAVLYFGSVALLFVCGVFSVLYWMPGILYLTWVALAVQLEKRDPKLTAMTCWAACLQILGYGAGLLYESARWSLQKIRQDEAK